jgi:hypothetical protein
MTACISISIVSLKIMLLKVEFSMTEYNDIILKGFSISNAKNISFHAKNRSLNHILFDEYRSLRRNTTRLVRDWLIVDCDCFCMGNYLEAFGTNQVD